jgi:DNA-binding SARP family transcriptional activator/Tol biopolymer transport system component
MEAYVVELRILGSPELLTTDEESAALVLRRPKRLAFLAYLAVESSGSFQRRDKLIGLFWPESDERRARSSLSEALSKLRQTLGPDVILTRGKEEVGVSREHLWCDVTALREAQTVSDLEQIARLYRGPLLEGLFLDIPGSFDHWLEQTRGQLERVALDAIGGLADATAQSDMGSALAWAERSVDLCPLDGPSLRRLVKFHARAGHRARALDVFAGYARRLAEEHGIDPSRDLIEMVSLIEQDTLLVEAPNARDDFVERPQPHPSDGEDQGPVGPVTAVARTSPPEVGQDVPPDSAPGNAGRRRSRWNIRPGLAASLSAVVVLGGWSILDSSRTPAVTRVKVTPSAESALPSGFGGVGFDLSPDGKRIVYVGEGPDSRRLWERRLDDLTPTPIAGTEGAWSPVYSPDGGSIAFWMENSLKTVSLGNGLLATLVEGLENDPSPHWDADGYIYYSPGKDIHRVPASGGVPERVTSAFPSESGAAQARLPDVLPNGRGLLVTLRKNFWLASVGLVEPGDGAIRELFQGETARYVESGHIVYSTAAGTLISVPFDLDRLEVTGAHAQIAEGVATSRATASGQFALSDLGDLVYRTRETPPTYQVVRVDRRGRASEVAPEWRFNGNRRFTSLALSPRGDQLAVSVIADGGVDLWIKTLEEGAPRRLTFDGRGNTRAAWSPDGEFLAFVRDAGQGEWQVAEKRADGRGEARPLEQGAIGTAQYVAAGDRLIYSIGEPRSDIYIRGIESVGFAGPAEALIATSDDERSPALSPDGQWLAYVSDETGRREVFVRSFPDVTAFKGQVSTSGGTEPLWSRNGRELFYRNGSDELVEVRVTDEPSFSAEDQEVLFSVASFLPGRTHPMYDAGVDSGFVMIRMADEPRPSELILIQNFRAELGR